MSCGTDVSRQHLRQVDKTPNADPEVVDITFEQPEFAELYYSANAKIDQHNRKRQDDLQLERKLGTKDWSSRVNLTLFGMMVVDAWLLFNGCRGYNKEVSQREFYILLADQLIHNSEDAMELRSARKRPAEVPADPSPKVHGYGGIHLSPGKKKKKKKPTQAAQIRCVVCGKQTTMICSGPGGCGKYVHPPGQDNKTCYKQHAEKEHAGRMCY